MRPFEPAPDFLSLSLQGLQPQQATWQQHGIDARWHGHGLLQLSPSQPDASLPHLLLSAGIHGNETAPIEVLTGIVNDLLAGSLPLQAHLLIVLGNLPAMRQGKRFIDYDMNRLFNGQHCSQPAAAEATRAAELEQLAVAFFGQATGAKRHYDLHTAIRGSVFERFAIYPYLHERPHNREQLMWLAQADIGTVLLHSKPAATFSYFTSQHCQADAFTLELGKARPFGQNDLSRFSGIDQALRQLVSGQQPATPAYDASKVQLFRASYDLIKHSGDFVLHLADDVENFTALPDGMLIAEDGAIRHLAKGGHERILFPNPRVSIGLRAGIVIAPSTLD
jgi:succinylglutamate desuccinylase